MGAVNTTYTFTATDTITSTKMNNIIDETVMTADAVLGGSGGSGGLDIASGKLSISANAINSSRLASSSVTTNAISDGAVTQDKLNAAIIFVPSGAIMAFAMNLVPTGWLHANGAAVSRTTYSALWTALGTTSSPYGQGDGSTTFNLPDLRGYFVRGSGMNSDGTASGTFGAKQADQFETHGHSASSNSTGAHTHSVIQTIDNSGGFDSGSGRARYGGSGDSTGSAGAHSHTITVSSPNSGTSGTETRPANIAMLHCIKI
jgi:microcystin-dependent protein